LSAPTGAARALPRPGLIRSIRSNLWVRFVVRRLLSLVGVFVFLVVGVFFMVQAVPGDPIRNFTGPDAPPQIIERIRHDNGLDKPLGQQFVDYVTHIFEGDFGKSYSTLEPVSDIIVQNLTPSLQLAACALFIVLVVSVPLGLLAGAVTREGRHRKVELGFMSVTSVLGAIPELLIATVLVFIVAVQLQWLPVAGAGSFEQLVLPAVSIALPATMTLSRIVRVETLNVLAQDYIRTARSKWLRPPRLFFRHVLPNVLTATLTIAGLLFAGLIAGAVIAENIFARPGLGTRLVAAILAKEYPVVQGIILVLGMAVVIVNALVDVILGVVDPRSLARHV
jgi:peptide/nickel transport system permease protein